MSISALRMPCLYLDVDTSSELHAQWLIYAVNLKHDLTVVRSRVLVTQERGFRDILISSD